MLRRIKFIESAYDGARTFMPGDMELVNTAFAKRCILLGHADFVDDDGEPIPLTRSYQHLKINMDDLIRRAQPRVLDKLRITSNVKRAREFYEAGKNDEYESICAEIQKALEEL